MTVSRFHPGRPSRPRAALGLLPFLVLASACGEAPLAHVTVGLAGPPTASPLVFHGNCLAGYAVRVVLRVQETEGVRVRVASLRYTFRDEGDQDGGGEDLDASALEARYGMEALDLPPRGTRDYALAWRFDSAARPPEDPPRAVAIAGELTGRDDEGRLVRAGYALRSAVTVIPYVPGPGGACP